MPVRNDAISFGQSPRFTAITAGASVRKGKGVLVGVTITAPAGAVVDLWDGPVGTGFNIWHYPATLGPGSYWIYQEFSNDLNIVIATAVTDLVVITAGE